MGRGREKGNGMNASCATVARELTAFAAGELDRTAAETVARHLAGCAGCRGELDRELVLRDALAALPTLSAPRGLGATPTTGRKPRRLPRSLTGAALLAAAAVVAALLAGWPHTTPAPEPLPQVADAAERAAARRDAVYGLVLTARILERTEKRTVADVFGRTIPRAVTESLRGTPPTPEGGQG